MLGCCGRERGHDRGRVDLQHHVGDQLLGQLVEERVAKRGKLDDQGVHVSAEAVVLSYSLDP